MNKTKESFSFDEEPEQQATAVKSGKAKAMEIVSTDIVKADPQVSGLAKQSYELLATANALTVKDASSMENAVEFLSLLSKAQKSIEERRKFFTVPLNEQVKRINALFKTYSEPLDKADEIGRQKVLEFRRISEAERVKRQEAIGKKAAKAQAALDKRYEKKGLEAPVVPVTQIQSIAASSVRTEVGGMNIRKKWDFEVVDFPAVVHAVEKREAQIACLMLDDKAVRKMVDAGIRNIPGIRIFEREDLVIKSL